VTYEELQKGVQSFKRELETRHFSHTIVAVLAQSDVPYVATILAIGAVRGVFAPVDTTWPDERLIAALEVGQPSLLIVSPDQRERATKLITERHLTCALAVVSFASDDRQFRFEFVPRAPGLIPNKHNSPEATWRQDSLYLSYTSGSTGTPSAVEGAHQSLAHFIAWQAKTFEIDSTCRVAQLAPTTFDVSLRDIFLPLFTGGTVLIPTAAVKFHPILLPEWILKHQVNVMHSVPSLFKFVSQTTRHLSKFKTAFYSLDKLFLSGERLYMDDSQF